MREQIEEFSKVENVARKFIEAVRTGNSEIVKPYFYEKASFSSCSAATAPAPAAGRKTGPGPSSGSGYAAAPAPAPPY